MQKNIGNIGGLVFSLLFLFLIIHAVISSRKEYATTPQNDLGWYAECKLHLWTGEPGNLHTIIDPMKAEEYPQYCGGQ